MGTVYQELDGSFGQDPFSEPGLEGWTVQLYWAATGQVIMTTTTNADGFYQFDGLGTGDYFVCIIAQPGYTQSYPTGTGVCEGLGQPFNLAGNIETWALHLDFAEVPPQ